MPAETHTEVEDASDENEFLKIGYAGILHERYPFQPVDKACYNEENAYVTALEREYLEVPPEMEFRHLKKCIDPKHHERLAMIWDTVEENYYELDEVCKDLHDKWTKDIPPGVDEKSGIILAESAIEIRSGLQNGVRAIISKADQGTPLRRWQREEKGLRRMVYERTKIFIVSLRLYYEMLLETSPTPDKTIEKEYVLPQDHHLRNEIANRNRYLRLIDATQSGISIGKAAHHGQTEGGRMRKTEKKPYIVHGIDVTHAAILDIIPHTLESGHVSWATLIGLIGPVHDIIEDTDLSLEDLINNYIKRLVDFYDSSLDPVIKSGFLDLHPENTRDKIKKRVLNLVKDGILKDIKQIIRILSNNCELSHDERMKMARECLAGEEVTRKVLKITHAESANWRLGDITTTPTKTFTEFPEEDESDKGKTSGFLIRLHGLAKSSKARQQTLCFKLEDRANNILTLDKMDPAKQRRALRSTTSRILAWAMLDHDNTQYPLYNALPRCTDNTIQAYQNLERNHPVLMEDTDRKYLTKLREWQTDVHRFEVPAKVQAVLDANRTLLAKEGLKAKTPAI